MKRIFLRITSALLTGVFAISSFTAYAADGVSGWAKEEVEEAIDLGIVPEKYRSDYGNNITREEFAITSLMYVAYQNNMDMDDMCKLYVDSSYRVPSSLKERIEKNKERIRLDETENGRRFIDVKGEYGTVANPLFLFRNEDLIYYAECFGIVKGRSPKVFDPDSPITREEAAVMLDRVCGLWEENNNIPEKDTGDIKDFDEVSEWAKESVKRIYSLDVMQGMPDGSFSPKGLYTREQCYATFMRLCKNENLISRYHNDNACFASFEDLREEATSYEYRNYYDYYSGENEFCAIEVGNTPAIHNDNPFFWIIYKNGGRKNVAGQFGKMSLRLFDEKLYEFSNDGKSLYCTWVDRTGGKETRRNYKIDLENAKVYRID